MPAKQFNLPKTLCFILRHKPEDFNLELDKYGYVNINDLVISLNKKYPKESITYENILEEVNTDSKGRYKIKNDLIKCSFGHSVHIEPELVNNDIPDTFYHGTRNQSVNSILKTGLRPLGRQFVHITSDLNVAKQVGLRHAKKEEDLVILEIDTKQMIENNIQIIPTGTTTYLIDYVAPEYIKNTKELI